MKAIDEIDCFSFVEDIDTESCAYKYLNSLNLFRYNYADYLNVYTTISQKSAPLSESAF